MTGRCTNPFFANLAVGALLLFAPCSRASIVSEIKPQPTTAIEIAQHHIDIARGLALNGNRDQAAIEFEKALQSKAFAQLSETYRHFVWFEAGNVALDLKKMAVAQGLLKLASESSEAGSQDWHNRLYASYALQDFGDSAYCITMIARRWSETLDQINAHAMYAVNRKLPDAPGQTTAIFNFLESLFDADWTDKGTQPNGFWVDLPRLLLDRGQVDKAILSAKRIDSPRMVLALRVDRRFDPVTRDRLSEFDVDRIAIASDADAEQEVKAHADQLRPVLVLHVRLMRSRQYARALEVCDEVIARVAGGNGAELYKDFDEEYIWILNSRAEALQGLDRMEEAVAVLRSAVSAEGKFDLAAARFRKSFEAFRASTGDSVYTWLTALLEVNALTDLEKFDRADARSAEATAALARISPDDAYNRMFSASVMGKLRQAEGRQDEAIPHLREALSGVEKIYDKDHAEIAQARIALAGSLISKNDNASRAEASALLEAGIETLARIDDAGGEPMLGVAYLERSRLNLQKGDRDAARADVRESISRLRSPEYATSLRKAEMLARQLGLG